MDVKEKDWYFVQVKGKLQDSEVVDSDIITSVVFNHAGDLLATGDKGGRVVVFQKSDHISDFHEKDEYNVYATFQSHEPDFDYLKSMDIEEKINKICWLRPCNDSHYILTTNDKTIKLFRINDKIEASNIKSGFSSRGNSFQDNENYGSISEAPSHHSKLVHRQSSAKSHIIRNGKCRRTYSNAHSFNIHSITACCDRDFFLSADDLRINLWNIERIDTCFTIVDARPDSMEDLSEVITSCQFHPSETSIFLYSSSRGCVKLCDTRLRSLCDKPAAIFEESDGTLVFSRFSEVVKSISDLNFAKNPRYFMTRNYLEVKIWDINMTKDPVETHLIHDYMCSDSKLSELYESDAIFDKFESRFSPDDGSILSASYGNFFNITRRCDQDNSSNSCFYEAACDSLNPLSITRQKVFPKQIVGPDNRVDLKKKRMNLVLCDEIKYNKRITALDWHPTENIIAIGANHNLYLYSQHECNNSD